MEQNTTVLAASPLNKAQEQQLQKYDATPANFIQQAIASNAPIENIERLMALYERWDAGKNRKKFFIALSDFQKNCPIITKNKKADFASKTGGKVSYQFATLDQIISDIREPLHNVGLSYRWETSHENNKITVTCFITHIEGHTESTGMNAGADMSGSKNEIQSNGSTITYLKRYTLCGALGIATADEDSDTKERKDGLHPDMKQQILDAKSMQELEDIYSFNPSLKNDKEFLGALSKRKLDISLKK